MWNRLLQVMIAAAMPYLLKALSEWLESLSDDDLFAMADEAIKKAMA